MNFEVKPSYGMGVREEEGRSTGETWVVIHNGGTGTNC